MLRGLIWTLRQKRYAALTILMVVLAAGCAGAGTFEVHRYNQKRSDNSRLIANARAAAVPLTPALVPLTSSRQAVDELAVRYRAVMVSGRYDAAAQVYLGNRSQDGSQGFWVVTPLRSASGTLLVARGFVPATPAGTRPAGVAKPPAGSVQVTGRLETASASAEQFGDEEVSAVDPQQLSQRLGTPVYQAYLTLGAGQPGTAGLRPLPGPTLSNPTGGASEWQLMSYVVQWYVFAALALAAPFLFARAEIRAARQRFLGLNPDGQEMGMQPGPRRAALGRGASPSRGADLAVRRAGAVARLSDVDPAVRRRAVRLADRYGLSLGPDLDADRDALARSHLDEPAAPRPQRRIGGVPDLPDGATGVPHRSSAGLSRSPDAYHGSYNDYLWLLALADGEVPDVVLPGEPAATADDNPAESRTIEGVVAEPNDEDQHG